jgi:hypothetical protein
VSKEEELVLVDRWIDSYIFLSNIWHTGPCTVWQEPGIYREHGGLDVYDKTVGVGDVYTHWTEFGTQCIGVEKEKMYHNFTGNNEAQSN